MFSFNNITFDSPEYFWLLALVPLMLGWYVWKLNLLKPRAVTSTLQFMKTEGSLIKIYLRHSPVALRSLGLVALVIALARPQSTLDFEDVTTEGIDIVIALDISSSMLAEDLKPNRLEAAKNIASEFVANRDNDRIGLVVYSGESFTQCPLTTDHDVLKNLFMDIRNGMIEDGTAIGNGLAMAVNRLKDSKAKSKVAILLTDGFNTAGSIPPLTAAEIAREFNVRVYTIGVGTSGKAPYPFKTRFGTTQYQDMEVQIDEPTLKGIAETTGGTYFRATDNKRLEEIYQEIDALEKSKIEVTRYRKKSEKYFPWAVLAFLLLVMEFALKNTVYKSIT